MMPTMMMILFYCSTVCSCQAAVEVLCLVLLGGCSGAVCSLFCLQSAMGC